MDKKILVVVCLAIVTIAFSGCNLPGGNKEEVKETNKTDQNQVSDSKNGNYFETLTDLMKRGKTMKCTYTQKIDNENTAEGIVYMADGNAHIEIIANKGTAHEGTMYSLTDDEWNYSWTKGSPKGYKMTLEASEMSEENQKTVSKMTDEIDFKCKSWKKDNSKFKVPTDITFQDMSEMMEGFGDFDIKAAEAEANKFLCEHCKNAPASEMAECLGDIVCD